jgi:hypothetical protein
VPGPGGARARAALPALLVVLASSCASGKGWGDLDVVGPSSLAETSLGPEAVVVVRPIDFSGVSGPGVDPYGCEWPGDPLEPCSHKLEDNFHSVLQANDKPVIVAPTHEPGDLVITPRVVLLDPGGGAENRPSAVRMRVEIVDRAGRRLETLEISSHEPISDVNRAPGFRVWLDGDRLAEKLREHLADRLRR